MKRIVLPSLQIIRGRTLFDLAVKDESFALLVTLSKMHTLEMPALRGKYSIAYGGGFAGCWFSGGHYDDSASHFDMIYSNPIS